MPRRYLIDDSESSASEFSETDVSYSPYGRHRVKRHSFSRSRHRLSPDSNAYLSPNALSTVRRSASTGHRRVSGRRGRDDTPIVVVDVKQQVRNRQESRDRHDRYERIDRHDQTDRHDRHDRHQQFLDHDDMDAIEILQPHRRARAASNVSAPRTPSPHRDWGLVMGQQILAARDEVRQDMELTKHQHDIERLGRKLARQKLLSERSKHSESHSRHRTDDFHHADSLAEKLSKLEQLERAKRQEEEERLAEVRAKVKRLEEWERKTEEEEKAKRLAHKRHLEEIAEREKVRAEKEQLLKELKDEEARKALEEAERNKELAILKAQAVEEYKRAEDAKRLRAIKEKEEKDREFKERLRAEFGYTEEQIERLLNKEKKEEKKEKKEKEKEKEKDKDGKLVILEPETTTFIKVHKKWLLPATLDAYRLPWDYDERDSNYIIIKKYITEEFQEELFAHTRRILEGKLVTETSTTLTELKVNDRKRDKMYLVRKKNPAGKAWIFT